MEGKPQSQKAVIVNSLSLSAWEWNYLKSLAFELKARDLGNADLDFVRASTSQAVRHLIQMDAKRRPKDADGNAIFQAGPQRERVLNTSTGTTTVQTLGTIVDLSSPKKKRGQK